MSQGQQQMSLYGECSNTGPEVNGWINTPFSYYKSLLSHVLWMQLPSFGSNLQFIWQCFHCWRNRYTWTRLEISRIQHWPAEKAGIYSRAELPHFVWKLKLFRRALGTHALGPLRPTLGLLEPSSHPTYLCHFSCGSSKQISSELKFSLISPRLQCLSFEYVWDTELGRKKKKKTSMSGGGKHKAFYILSGREAVPRSCGFHLRQFSSSNEILLSLWAEDIKNKQGNLR